MRTIYRYPLAITDVQTIEAPGLIEFLSVDGSRSDSVSYTHLRAHET